MTDGSTHSSRLVIRGGILLAACGLLWAHAMVFNFVNDDAYISFRYADNLVRHGDLVFNNNPGERVEGYTNFLWTMLMAGVMSLGLDVVPWSKWLGIASALGSMLVITRFIGRYQDKKSPWDGLGPLMLAAAPAYACWSTGGLETQFFTLFATLGWTQYLLEQDESEGMPWSGVFFALSAMARPEGMLFFGLTGLHRLGTMLFVERTFKPRKRDWVWGFGFLFVFGPYYAWRWTYYGWPFPNTYYVKTGAKGFWKPGLRYFWTWVRDHHLWAWPVLAIMGHKLPGRRYGRLLLLILLYTVAICVHVIRVGGDFMALNRFFVPLMPALAVVAALGFRTIAERIGGADKRRWIAVAVIALGLSVGHGWHVKRIDDKAMTIGSEGGVDSIGWLSLFEGQCTTIGLWLRNNAPPDSTIAVTAAGIIPFYSRLYTIDILALNDEWIAHNVKAHGSRPGHTKSAPLSYLLEKDIDFMIYHPIMSKHRPRQGSGQKRTWKRRGYEWFTVQVPGLEPPWWGTWRKISSKK